MSEDVSPLDGIVRTDAVICDQIHEPRIEDPIEKPVAEANRRGRNAALGVLSTLAPTMPLADLAQTTDSGTFHFSPAEDALHRVFDLMDPEKVLNDLFTWSDLHGDQLVLVREKDYVAHGRLLARMGPGGRPRVRAAHMARLMMDGYTVVLNGVDLRDPISMRLAEAAERVFGCAANINGYLSVRPPMSFGAHWDTQEVIILQLLGQKEWSIEEPLALSMVKEVHGEPVSGRSIWQGTLKPGDALYVPRGWGHRVSSVDELSYHYTLTLPRKNGLAVLEHLLVDASDGRDELFSLPIVAGRDQFVGPRPEFDDSAFRRSVAQARMEIAARSTQKLSDAIAAFDGDADDFWVRCPFGGGWLVGEYDHRRILIGGAGREFLVDLRLLETVACWADGLARRLPRKALAVRDLVMRLVRLGILDVSRGTLGWGQPIAPGPE